MTLFREAPELLAQFRRGERPALERMYWTYLRTVEHIIRRGLVLKTGIAVAGARGRDAEDLVQDVFARAFEERARLGYDGIREYKPYLVTIARNLLVDRARRGGREVAWSEVLEEIAEATAPEELEAWADSPTLAMVEGYLSGLPEELKRVHEQRYVLGVGQEKAAATLGISRQTLRTREHQLREGLKRLMKDR